MLDHKSPSLPVSETLIVLASCADTNPSAKAAMEKLKEAGKLGGRILVSDEITEAASPI